VKSVTDLKNLRDIRTTLSTHGRSAPRKSGMTYLEVFLLDRRDKDWRQNLPGLIDEKSVSNNAWLKIKNTLKSFWQTGCARIKPLFRTYPTLT